MKKTKINQKHLLAIFAFLLSAVVVFCGVQIWQEYSSRQKDIDAFVESLRSWQRSRSLTSRKKQRSWIQTAMRRIRIRRRNRKILFAHRVTIFHF